jgi:hypothetical protein
VDGKTNLRLKRAREVLRRQVSSRVLFPASRANNFTTAAAKPGYRPLYGCVPLSNGQGTHPTHAMTARPAISNLSFRPELNDCRPLLCQAKFFAGNPHDLN